MLLLQLLTILSLIISHSFGHSLRSNKKGQSYQIFPDPEFDDDDKNEYVEEILLYNSDKEVTTIGSILDEQAETKKPTRQQTKQQLSEWGELILEILRSINDTANEQKCLKYRDRINDVCLEKYLQRSRQRIEWNFEDETLNDLFSIANAQQICCEFRQIYLRCLVSSLNLVCPPNEFNAIYDQVRGLSEICSRYFHRSSRKCRRRYSSNVSFRSLNDQSYHHGEIKMNLTTN